MSSKYSDPAIRVEGLGKQYMLGASAGGRATYRSVREELARAIRRRERASAEAQKFWALRNLSLDIQPGERVGIIGRNGAGESTLLKLLARITAPTEGRIEIRGRVGSLLEVGTGFHPELSGRDNILLSGAILGMRKSEIRAKTDEIVDFAGVASFLDTPVKRYSSGMYLRLAFAVAAYLEPEILLVDEVLAVGDAEFQKKCLGRMEQIGETGRTVLFVSHSAPSILRLCERVVLLDRGGVVADGSAQVVLRKYLESGLGSAAERHWETPEEAPGDDVARLKAVVVRDDAGTITEKLDIRRPVAIEVSYWHLTDDPALKPTVSLQIKNEDGVLLFITHDYNNTDWRAERRARSIVTATCHIPGNFLAEGRFFVLAALATLNPTHVHATEADVVSFHIIDQSTGDGVRGEYVNEYPGVVRPMLDWSVSTQPLGRGPGAEPQTGSTRPTWDGGYGCS